MASYNTYILVFILNLLNVVIDISWKTFGTVVDNVKCVENDQPIVEYYKIDEYQYMFFSERVSWDEAKTICPIYDARLAVVDSKLKVNKLATAIAESNIDMEAIWIGGERSQSGNWSWTDDELIPTQAVDGYPPWARSPDRPWKQCLGLDRVIINAPLFVDLDCRLPKPFICHRDVDAPANVDVTLPSHMVTIGRSTYILYHARLTWGTAATFCRMRGYKLAIIPNNKVAKIVSIAMIRSRPSFENIWLSGHFTDNKWRWLSTAEIIPSYPDKNNYPPWHHNSTNSKSGCILFDSHVCDDPVFVTSTCDRKCDFVCEKYVKRIKIIDDTERIKISYKHWTMILFLKALSWYAAEKYCNNRGAYLTEVYDYDMMKTITTAMSDQETEPVHVWLGGILQNDTWIWKHSDKPLPVETDKTGFMPWCDIDDKADNSCLNMDREAHDKPAVYGLRCKLKQPFICTEDELLSPTWLKEKKLLPSANESKPGRANVITKLTTLSKTKPTTTTKAATSTTLRTMTIPTTTTTILPPITATIKTTKPTEKLKECNQEPVTLALPKGKIYVSFFTRLNFEESKLICTHAGGKLARIGYYNELQLLIKELRQNVPDCAARHMWIQTPQNCAYIRYDTGKVLLSETCSRRKGYICEMYCSHSLPDSKLFKNNLWSCSNYEDNKICRVSCKNGFVLEGTDAIMCTTAGWVDAYNKTSLLPICQGENNVSIDLVHFLREISKLDYHALYIIDESQRVTSEEWWQQLQFIASLVEAVPISQSFRTGLIKYHNRGTTSIPFNITDTCEFLEILHKLRPEPNRNFRFYKPALEEAEKQVKLLPGKGKAVIILITTGINHGSEYKNVITRLQQKHKIFPVGIGDEANEDLGVIASVMHDQFLFYKFGSFKSLEYVTSRIISNRSKKLDCPGRLYTLPRNHLCHEEAISIYNNGTTYVGFFTPVTYLEAQTKCADAGGSLASNEYKNLEGILTTILKKAKACQAVELWIDDGKAPCATAEMSYEETENKSLNCTPLHGPLCEICLTCADYPKNNDKYNKNIWNCTKSTNTRTHTCNVECIGNAVLEGTDTVTCGRNGWTTINNLITCFPICLSQKDAATSIISVIKELKQETDGCLFLIDRSGFNLKTEWNALEIVSSIIKVYPLSPHYPMGLIIFDQEIEVVIPYKATNTCMVLKQLRELLLDAPLITKPKIIYEDILKAAEQQILRYQPKSHTAIYFVTDRANNENEFIKMAELLKQRHVLFSIGIGTNAVHDLNSVTSMFNDKLLHYKFNEYQSYNTVMKMIGKKKSSALEC